LIISYTLLHIFFTHTAHLLNGAIDTTTTSAPAPAITIAITTFDFY